VIVHPASAKPIDYALIGHMTADLTPEGRRVGGTVSYAIRTASAFGLRVGLLTSADPTDPLLDELAPYGQVVVVPSDHTTTFENAYSEQGRTQYIRAVAGPLRAEHVPPAWGDAPLLHVGPIAGEGDDLDLFARFEQARWMVTLQGWLRQWDASGLVRFKPWFRPALLQRLDLLVFSEEDVRQQPGMLHQIAPYAKNLLYTQAERGGLHLQGGLPTAFRSPLVEQPVDPTGAGDVFATSVLCALYLTGSIRQAVQVGAALAANCVTRVGISGVPTPQEVGAALAAVQA
jgi:sugar/nucleoside kinase (ribokinase family)